MEAMNRVGPFFFVDPLSILRDSSFQQASLFHQAKIARVFPFSFIQLDSNSFGLLTCPVTQQPLLIYALYVGTISYPTFIFLLTFSFRTLFLTVSLQNSSTFYFHHIDLTSHVIMFCFRIAGDIRVPLYSVFTCPRYWNCAFPFIFRPSSTRKSLIFSYVDYVLPTFIVDTGWQVAGGHIVIPTSVCSTARGNNKRKSPHSSNLH